MSFQAIAKTISVIAQGQFAEFKTRATDKTPGAKWIMAYNLVFFRILLFISSPAYPGLEI